MHEIVKRPRAAEGLEGIWFYTQGKRMEKTTCLFYWLAVRSIAPRPSFVECGELANRILRDH